MAHRSMYALFCFHLQCRMSKSARPSEHRLSVAQWYELCTHDDAPQELQTVATILDKELTTAHVSAEQKSTLCLPSKDMFFPALPRV